MNTNSGGGVSNARRRSQRAKERRYSLPARVNVLLYNSNGQPTQVSDHLAQQLQLKVPPKQTTRKSTLNDQIGSHRV